MSAIKPGDVVVCVAGRFSSCPNRARHIAATKKIAARSRLASPVVGRHYVVANIITINDETGIALVGLGHHGWCAGRFRKIRPADEQFTNHIRALKPEREDA